MSLRCLLERFELCLQVRDLITEQRDLTTLRKGHTVLFWVGIFLPFLWIVGALMHPTDSALAAEGGRAV